MTCPVKTWSNSTLSPTPNIHMNMTQLWSAVCFSYQLCHFVGNVPVGSLQLLQIQVQYTWALCVCVCVCVYQHCWWADPAWTQFSEKFQRSSGQTSDWPGPTACRASQYFLFPVTRSTAFTAHTSTDSQLVSLITLQLLSVSTFSWHFLLSVHFGWLLAGIKHTHTHTRTHTHTHTHT